MRINTGAFVKVRCSEVIGQNWIDTANVVRSEILRHVDSIEDADVELEYTCSLCKRSWETDDDGLPQCCNAAQDEAKGNE